MHPIDSSGGRPLILLTNDDGILSPGLRAAAEALCVLGELLIVAPAEQQTGMGRAMPALDGDARLQTRRLALACQDVQVYTLNASPAQAVLFGVLAIAQRRPALVVSGINHGENLGTAVTASGTVGAALMAAELGIPGLAVSFETEIVYHFDYAHKLDWAAPAYFTRLFARAMLDARLPFDVDVLKIDVPGEATAETPWRITRQSKQPYYESLAPEQRFAAGPLRPLNYRVFVNWDTLEPDSDISVFARDRQVAVTPLSHDLTARTDLAALEARLRG
ncbi:MAG: 5'-nucleotidase SurE [Chloroflexi bacterium ADurb.Bin325]|nr:MAG: 5'-nucleotidase SurE [Chloroflexi bacterium ADurb.Bin325]